MVNIRIFTLCSFLCIALLGCATIMNGSTQNVYIIAPQGTTIQDSGGIPLSIGTTVTNENYIKLKRNRDYVLHFENNDQEVVGEVPRSIGAGWVVLDIIFDIVPVFIDWATGDWNSFDDLKIHFVDDTSRDRAAQKAYIEPFERVLPIPPDTTPKIGGIFIAGAGLAMPVDQTILFFNGYEIGVGYSLLPKLDFILTASVALALDITAPSTHYGTNATSAFFSLETRYNLPIGIYGTAGGGWAKITSDSMRTINSTVLFPINKQMGAIFAGIGFSGSLGFIELRHTFGLSKIQFSNGETTNFATTSLNFGFNVHF
jgi:hypothetical protein